LLAPECKADATTMTLPAIKNGAACIRKETDAEFGGSALSTKKFKYIHVKSRLIQRKRVQKKIELKGKSTTMSFMEKSIRIPT